MKRPNHIGLTRAIGEMKRGADLHLHYGNGGRPIWRLASGWFVTPEIAELIIRSPGVVAGNDALFSDALSQTWRINVDG